MQSSQNNFATLLTKGTSMKAFYDTNTELLKIHSDIEQLNELRTSLYENKKFVYNFKNKSTKLMKKFKK